MPLPNFLIVGAMKSGTTTLSDYLAQHPQIFIPKKEVHFFNRSDRYPHDLKGYKKQFKQAKGKVAIGEKTPTYSYHPEVPARIHATLPNVKLIWIFREPIARAYSNYWHAVKSGSEYFSFEAAIRTEAQRIQTNIFKGYLKRSLYVEQVERYLQFFPKEQMLFLLFEELVRSPQDTLKTVFQFLEVEDSQAIALLPKQSNVTYVPRSIYLEWLTKRLFGKSSIYKSIHRFNQRKVQGYPPLSAEMRSRLQQVVQPYNDRLADLIDRDLSLWSN